LNLGSEDPNNWFRIVSKKYTVMQDKGKVKLILKKGFMMQTAGFLLKEFMGNIAR